MSSAPVSAPPNAASVMVRKPPIGPSSAPNMAASLISPPPMPSRFKNVAQIHANSHR